VIEVARVTEIVREVAKAEILPRFRNLQAHQIREKSPNNLVTEADVEAEKALGRYLTELLPGSLVVGEEAVSADHSVLEALKGEAPVWVLDPVDGTANFAQGRATFGVIVALVQGGRTRAGWIHDPIADVTATVQAGQGAWIGDRRLQRCAPPPLSAMIGSLGYRRSKQLEAKVHRLVRQGAVAHDYLGLARGEIHFAYYRKLTPWDHAAGVLMFQEAGGFAQLIDGSPYRPLPSQVGVLLAPDEASWRELRHYLANANPP
jgi:fructose-1,6-bisphosphatase/inositol monophosphatase family enzyme